MARTHKRIPDEQFIKYHPENDELSIEEKRREYMKLRKIANQRLKGFEGTSYTKSQTYLKNVGKYVPQSQISDRDIKYMLYEVAKFVDAKSSSISGIRDIERRTIETAHDRGLTWLNKGNLQSFGQFMEECRAKGYARLYGSERCAELFGTASKKGLDPAEVQKDFGYWMESQEALENAPKFRNKEMRTSENYKERLAKLKK